MVLLSNYFIVIALVAVGAWVWLPRDLATHRRRSFDLAARLGRHVGADGDAAVSRRSLFAQRLSITGAVVVSGFLVFVLAGLEQAFTAWVVVTGAFLGASAGALVAAIVDSRTLPAGSSVRLARARSVAISDLVPGVLRARSISAAVFAVAASAAMSLLFPLAWRWGAGIIVIVTLCCLVLAEVGGRWLAGQAQRASSLEEMAWNDAFRSRTLRWASGALVAAGLCVAGAVVVTLLSAGSETPPSIPAVASVCSVVPLAGLLWWFSDRPATDQRFYLTTLWADRDAGTSAAARGAE